MIHPSQREYPHPDDLEDVDELTNALGRITNPTLTTSAGGWGGDVYLPLSWLQAIHLRVRRLEGTALHADRLPHGADERQALVAIANRVEVDAGELLEADPEEELRALYEAVWELEQNYV